MKRSIELRVWDVENERYLEDAVMWSVAKMPDEMMPGHIPFIPLIMVALRSPATKYLVEQFTGLKDANGKDIYEGDILIASEARYEETLLSDPDSDDIPVYFSDVDKPLPAPDVPWFKASVEWNETMCGFWLRYLEKRADWGPGTSTALTDKMYRYEVVGNIHES